VAELPKAPKTGGASAAPQFRCVERGHPLMALLRVGASPLLPLRDLSRNARLGDLPAPVLKDGAWVDSLSGWRYRQQRPLSVGAIVLAWARRGGHQNRPCDGAPGGLVRWRGWSTLQPLVAGARASRCPKPDPGCAAASDDTAQVNPPESGP
jgi:hypothetical protein